MAQPRGGRGRKTRPRRRREKKLPAPKKEKLGKVEIKDSTAGFGAIKPQTRLAAPRIYLDQCWGGNSAPSRRIQFFLPGWKNPPAGSGGSSEELQLPAKFRCF